MTQTSSILFPSGTITSATSVVGPFDVTQYQTVSIILSGTYAGVNATFEVSEDGVVWAAIAASNINSASITSATGVLTSNSTNGWDIAVGSFAQFRVRATAWTSGSALIQVSGGSLAYDPGPNVQVANGITLTQGSGSNVQPTPIAGSGGVSTNHHLVAAGTTNATSVKASSGSIGSIVLCNTAAAIKFFKVFNKASAPTVGTDVPVITIGIPAATTYFWDPANYYRLTTGIAYAITNLSPDLDATAVTAGDVIVSINYV